MKVVRAQKDTIINASDIDPGECFEYQGDYFLRVCVDQDTQKKLGLKLPAVRLADGLLMEVEPNLQVSHEPDICMVLDAGIDGEVPSVH